MDLDYSLLLSQSPTTRYSQEKVQYYFQNYYTGELIYRQII